MSTAADFLRAVFDDTDGLIEIRPLPDKRGGDMGEAARARRWLPLGEACHRVDHVAGWCRGKGFGAFYGVLPRKESGSGTKGNVAAGRVAWADLDFKGYPGGESEARDLLSAMRIPPSIVVASGHGLHAYWLLSELTAPAQIEALNTGIRDALRSDDCHNSDRILRLPDSWNVKDPSDPRPVVIEHLDADHRVHPSRLPTGHQPRPGDARYVAPVDLAPTVAITGPQGNGHLASEWADRVPVDGKLKVHCPHARGRTTLGSAWLQRRPGKLFLHCSSANHGHPTPYKALLRLQPAPSVETGAPEPWGTPIPLTAARDLPCFPLEVLPGWLHDYAVAVSESLGVVPDLCGMLALGVGSLALSQVVRVEAKADWELPVNLYLVAAMPPGAKKSPALSAFLQPVYQRQRDLEAEWRPKVAVRQEERRHLDAMLKKARSEASRTAGTQAGEAAAAQVKALTRDLCELEPLSVPRMLADDSTPEALVSILQANGGRVALVTDEGGPFQTMAGRYSDRPNLDVYLKAWEGTAPIRVDRVGREPEHVETPAITMILAVQPHVLERLAATPELQEQGLIPRLICSIPDCSQTSARFDTPPIPVEVRARYTRAVGDLLRLHPCVPGQTPDPHVLRLSPAARDVLERVYTDIHARLRSGGDLDMVATWASKRTGTVAKLAAILHVCEAMPGAAPWGRPIEASTMLGAAEVLDYLIPHSLQVHALLGADEVLTDARYLLERLQSKAPEVFSERDALELGKGRLRKMARVRPALARLAEHGWVRRVPMPRGEGPGRSRSPLWEQVRPEHYSHNPQN